MNTAKRTRSEEQAATQMDSIREMVEALDTKNETEREEAEQAIHEDALEISIREDWHAPGETSPDKEYLILLCTGGPAVRIIGDLNEHNEPSTSRLEHRDWGTSWTEYREAEMYSLRAVLLEYARQFYFGE